MLLTAGERVLLHLLGFWNAKEAPEAISQQGIAEAARLRRSHVPRTVKALLREGHVEEREGRVRGRGRKVKLYYLTEAGLRRARELATALEAQPIVADEGPSTLGAFAKETGRSLLALAYDLDEQGRYRGPTQGAEARDFLGRRDELATLTDWVRGEGTAMVVYGGVGMGKTALARQFLERLSRPAWWRDVTSEDTSAALWADLRAYLEGRGRTILAGEPGSWPGIADALAGLDALLVLDNYGDVPEDVVDFVAQLLAAAHRARAKVLVLAQETTPSYCRFYDRKAVEARRVQELHLRGLGAEESRALLGNPDIADEAFQRIYLLTKGCPLYLKLIREGDTETLRARSRFTTAEVNLLLFSRDAVS